MKKLTTMLLSAAMILSLAGCGGKQDPKEIYDAAAKKAQEMTSVDASYVLDMNMTQGEENMDMSMDMNMKIDGINSESMRYLMDGTTSAMGQSMPTNMYYEGGYCYMDLMGQKVKYAMDLDEMTAQATQSLGGVTVDSSYLKDIKAEKDGDNQVLTFTADASKMDTYAKDLMSSMGSAMDGLGDITYTIKEVSGESVVNKDGYFSSAKIKMVMEMSLEGETVSVDMDMDMTYNNPGQAVEITAPGDLDSYTEIDASMLGL